MNALSDAGATEKIVIWYLLISMVGFGLVGLAWLGFSIFIMFIRFCISSFEQQIDISSMDFGVVLIEISHIDRERQRKKKNGWAR